MATAVTPSQQIPRPGSDGTLLPIRSQIRREQLCPNIEVQGKSRGSSIAAILEHRQRSSSSAPAGTGGQASGAATENTAWGLLSSHIVGPFGELRILIHQLRLEMLLVGKDVPLPLGDCLLLTDPDFLCNLRANTQRGGGGGARFAVQIFTILPKL